MRHTPPSSSLLAMCSAPALAQTSATKPPVPHHQILVHQPVRAAVQLVQRRVRAEDRARHDLGVDGGAFRPGLELFERGAAGAVVPAAVRRSTASIWARAPAAIGLETSPSIEYATAHQPQRSRGRTRPYPIVTTHRQVFPGVGLEVGYNWLLGPEQNVSVGLGFGLTRLLRESRRRLLLSGHPATSAPRQHRDRVLERSGR